MNARPENESPEGLTDSAANSVPHVTDFPSDTSGLATIPKIVKFDALARCGDEIWIENEGQIYRLRKTRQGKLILTK